MVNVLDAAELTLKWLILFSTLWNENVAAITVNKEYLLAIMPSATVAS